MPTWLIGEDIQRKVASGADRFSGTSQANMDMGIYALYLPNRRHSVRVKAFIDFLMKRWAIRPIGKATLNLRLWHRFDTARYPV